MNSHPDNLLPFYANRTLPASASDAVETHLADCPYCREQLEEWKGLAVAVNQAADDRLQLASGQNVSVRSSLSPFVHASLNRRPPFKQAILSAAHLIWIQRIFLMRPLLAPVLGVILLLGVLASLAIQGMGMEWAVFPLFATVPIIAILASAFLNPFDDDPAFEIISAAPTPPSTLVFARLTLSLGTISLLAFLCCLLLATLGQLSSSFFELVATWLGPMLLLSALTTVLSLCLRPYAAAGTVLVAWASVIGALILELSGTPLVKISLLPLLHPSLALLAGQALLAGFLWMASRLWLSGGMSFSPRLGRNS
jgi:anti-sigma factor RsiW